MTTVTWKNNADGNWSAAANWTPSPPTSTTDVLINTANPHTITHSAGTDSILSIVMTSGTLAMTGGALKVLGNASIAAAVTDSAGTLTFAGANASISQNVTQAAAGTINVASGWLHLTGATNSFAGTLSGAAVEFAGTSTTLAAGLTFAMGEVLISSGTVTLGVNIIENGTWSQTAGTLALGGKTLTVKGHANFDGGVINGAGTAAIAATATGEIAGTLFLEGSAALKNAGKITMTSGWYLGYNALDTSQLINQLGATFTIANASNINSVSGAALTNAGTLVKSGGGTSVIYASTTSTGTVTVSSGVLNFGGTANTFDGKINGGGTLQLSAGANTFASGLLVTVANVALTAGSLTLGGNIADAATWAQTGGTLALGGNTLTLSGTGNLDGGVINGAGTVAMTGDGEVSSLYLEGSIVLANSGAVSQTNFLYVGYNATDTVQFNNLAGATYTIASNANIAGAVGAKLTNAGSIVKLGGGTTTIGVATASTGNLTINAGILSFSGGTNSFGGTIGGAGTLQLTSGTDTFQAGIGAGLTVRTVALTGASVTLLGNLSYAQTWTQTGGTLALGGKTLTLSGFANFDGGVINGAGNVVTSGLGEMSGLFLEGSAVLKNSGSIIQTGNFYLGYNGTDTSQFVNQATGTFTLADGGTIYSVAGSSLTNAGSLVKSGSATAQVTVSTQSSGNVIVNAGLLNFTGSGDSFGGSIAGAGTLLFNGGTDTFLAGLSLTIAAFSLGSATLTLGDDQSYAGIWTQTAGTLALGGNKLTLSGTANLDGGAATGSGTIAVTGGGEVAAYYLEGSAVLANSGNLTQTNYLYVGYNAADTAKFNNLAGGTYTIANNSYIYGTTGSALTNAGTFNKFGGGLSQISVSTTSTGVLNINSGVVNFTGSNNNFGGTIGGAGILQLGSGTDTFAATLNPNLTVAGVALTGAALTIGGNLTYGGTWTQTAGSVALGGKTLTLTGTANLDGGALTGAGSLVTKGVGEINALALQGSTMLKNSGNLLLNGYMYDGYNAADTAKLMNLAGATFTIADASTIYSVAGASLNNAGSLVKTGSGVATINAATTNTGSISINTGVLSFNGANNSFAGAVGGAGTLQLATGSDAFAAGLALSTGAVALTGATLTLNTNVAYAGSWTQSGGTLALGGKVLNLTGIGNLDGGVINGAGTIAVKTGEISTLALEGSAVLKNAGNITQTNYWYLGYNAGDTSSLNNTAAATFTIARNADILGSAGATLNNAGSLVKSGGSGLTSIAVATINTGNVEVGSGTMAFLSTVSGSGTFTVDDGTTLKFGGAVASGSAVTLGASADLFVNATAGFAGSIAGFAAGNLIDLTGMAFAGATMSFNAGLDKLTVTNGATSVGLQLVGGYTAADFHLFSDGGIAAISHT